ncbi:MAG: hypothetical protein ACREN2_07665 [Candidatus Dormibacteria bacterium]
MNARGSVRLPALAGAAVFCSLVAACGGSSSPSIGASTTWTSGPASSAAGGVSGPATPAQLQADAAKVYPPCLATTCSALGAKFTTCDSGLSGSVGAMGDTLAPCPLTARMRQQLQADTDGVISAPDPLGGGQQEAFMSESFTAEPSGTGGVVHVSLVAAGGGVEKTDLVFADNGSGLQLDDVYCAGHDAATTDAYVAGWLTRATCGA